MTMTRPHEKTYYFKHAEYGGGYEHRDTTGTLLLEWLVGDTIANAFCDADGCIELVRFHRPCEDLVVLKRLSDIRATVTKHF